MRLFKTLLLSQALFLSGIFAGDLKGVETSEPTASAQEIVDIHKRFKTLTQDLAFSINEEAFGLDSLPNGLKRDSNVLAQLKAIRGYVANNKTIVSSLRTKTTDLEQELDVARTTATSLTNSKEEQEQAILSLQKEVDGLTELKIQEETDFRRKELQFNTDAFENGESLARAMKYTSEFSRRNLIIVDASAEGMALLRKELETEKQKLQAVDKTLRNGINETRQEAEAMEAYLKDFKED